MNVFDPSKPSEFKKYVRLQVNILEYIGKFVELEKEGRHYKGRCPFHPEGVNKHIFVYPTSQKFICHSPGCSGGYVFDFIAKQRGIDKEEAIKVLAEELGIRSSLIEKTPKQFKEIEIDKQISFSMLKLFKQCPLRYKFRYIDHKTDQKTTAYLAMGRILHSCLGEFFKLDNKRRTSDALKEILENRWSKLKFPGEEEEKEEYKLSAEKLLIDFFNSHKCDINTYKVEARVKCNIKGLALTGAVDRIAQYPDGSYEIIDYKTEQRELSDETMDNMQLAFYYYGVKETYKIPISQITLDYLPSQQVVTTKPHEKELEKYLDLAWEIVQKIRDSKDFPATRNRYCMDCVFCKSCSEFNK